MMHMRLDKKLPDDHLSEADMELIVKDIHQYFFNGEFYVPDPD